MGGRVSCIAVGLLAAATASALAQAQKSDPVAACHSKAVGSGKVARIIDGRSFVLDDGREIRLASIEIPPLPGSGNEPRAAAGLAAKAALESILADRTVTLHQQQRGATDRYGRLLADVYVSGDAPERSVAGELLARGYARVAIQAGHAACSAELLLQERAARAAKLGLWTDPYYALRRADNVTELLAERGRFTVAEGKVVSVRESGGVIYVNFGRVWSRNLTVTISKRNERVFTAAGIEPKKLEGRRLRVRGWIEERNGPRIEAARPEQIEIADAD
ncbi:MAG: hypothetical protein QOD40_2427 [Alphaproteobacteria bacterium]|jgi:endonuclease YncB( thermonuclease family)|nr:hypothetical protein [Alphaproteobacteria bacterium]